MDFKEAYKKIVERSVEKNTKEIPTILSCLDFEDKTCLEVGAGFLARIALKIAGFAKHITCLEKESDSMINIKALAEYYNLEKKISPIYYPGYEKENFPFKDNLFDVVYCAWLPHKTITDTKFLDELIRATKKHILILMPGIKGDEPKLISLIRKGERKRRLEYKEFISNYLTSKDFKVDFKENILKLEFFDEQEIRDVFYSLAFKNKLTEKEKIKINKFLDKRVRTFKDGFYIIHGIKRE
jgi:ubiquinone/menaquinone biosynthesis C-methylase UbiE